MDKYPGNATEFYVQEQTGEITFPLGSGNNFVLGSAEYGTLDYEFDPANNRILSDSVVYRAGNIPPGELKFERFGIKQSGDITYYLVEISPDLFAVDDGGNYDRDGNYTSDGSTILNTGNVLDNDITEKEPRTINVIDFDTTNTVGIVTNNGDGTFKYDPNGKFDSLSAGESDTDSFTYTIADSSGETDTAIVSIDIQIPDLTVNTTEDLNLEIDPQKREQKISLRSSIEYANNNPELNEIRFEIPQDDPGYDASTGIYTIQLNSPLPDITDVIDLDGEQSVELRGNREKVFPGLTIDTQENYGTSFVKGLTINNFGGAGILVKDGSTIISDNKIGTNFDGTQARGNLGDGIVVESKSATIADNVISGNSGNGIRIDNESSTSTESLDESVSADPSSNVVVTGNKIGTDINGENDLGNGKQGIRIAGNNNAVGGLNAFNSGNTIAFNQGAGISVASGTGNLIVGNSIFDNQSLGIDLGNDGITNNDLNDADAGANNQQNFPLASIVEEVENDDGSKIKVITGKFNSTPNAEFRLEFFTEQGKNLVGAISVFTDEMGNAQYRLDTEEAVGTEITATATNLLTNDTSEFSSTNDPSQSSSTSPIIIDGNFKDPDGDGIYELEGNEPFYIGRDDGIKNILKIEPTSDTLARYDRDKLTIYAGSKVSSLIPKEQFLFQTKGRLEIPFGNLNPTSAIDEKEMDDNFSLAGLNFDFSQLTIQPDRLRLGGEFSLPDDVIGQPLTVPVADALIFEGDDISLGASGSISFPNPPGDFRLLDLLNIKASGLKIAYAASTDIIKIHGTVDINSFTKPRTKSTPNRNNKSTSNRSDRTSETSPFIDTEITLDFSEAEENFIKIEDSKTTVRGSLSVKDIKLPKGFGLEEAKITLDTDSDHKSIGGSVAISFPFGSLVKPKKAGVSLGLLFQPLDPLELDAISAEGKLDNLAIGSTGAFLQTINGSLNNIAPSSQELVEFAGEVNFTAGPKFKDLPGDPRLLDITLGAKVNEERIAGKADIFAIATTLLQANAEVNLNWNKEFLSVDGDFDILDGSITSNNKFTVYSDYNLIMRGDASIRIPKVKYLPSAGQELADGKYVVRFTNNENLSDDYIKAWAEIPNPFDGEEKINTGFKFYFDNNIDLLDSDDILALKYEHFGAKEVEMTNSWEVAPETEFLLVNINWDNATSADVPVRVIDNKGNVISEADFAANKIAIVDELTSENNKTVIIDSPDPGTWDVEVVDDSGLGEITYFASEDSDAPTIKIIDPAVDVAGGEVEITYEAFDADSEAEVSLFFDTDNQDFDGILITSDLLETDGEGSFVWNTQGIPVGEYYIYSMVADENNPPEFVYSTGTVQITEAADLVLAQAVDTEAVGIGEEQTYTVTVTNSGEDESQGVVLTASLPEGATFVSATIEPQNQDNDFNSLTFDLGNIANEETKSVDLILSASNIIGSSINGFSVESNTYDPDFTNNFDFVTTNVSNSQLIPELLINDASIAEADDGNSNLIFIVNLSKASDKKVTANYATADDSAIAGEDYIATNGTLEFAPGETEKTITVSILNDDRFEAEESFILNLTSSDNSALADTQVRGIITNDLVDPLVTSESSGLTGSLSDSDDAYIYQNQTYYYDFFALPVDSSIASGDIVKLHLTADNFDPMLMILDGDGNVISHDDNYTEDSTHSELTFVVGEAESFFVSVESRNANGTGDYNLTVETIDANLGNLISLDDRSIVNLDAIQTVDSLTGSLEAGDVRSLAGERISFTDAYWLADPNPEERVELTLESDFDGAIAVHQIDSNGDLETLTPGESSETFSFTVSNDLDYLILVESMNEALSGVNDYTLTTEII